MVAPLRLPVALNWRPLNALAFTQGPNQKTTPL